MAQLYPILTGQQGIYYTGSPNYVHVKDTYLPLVGMRTFFQTATAENWVLNDVLSINIQKGAENYKVWTGYWDPTYKRIRKLVEEVTIGTIVNTDNVDVTATLSSSHLRGFLAFVNPIIITESAAEISAGSTTIARNLHLSENGQTIICRNTIADLNIYLENSLNLPSTENESFPFNYHFRIIRESKPVSLRAFPNMNQFINGQPNLSIEQFKQKFVYYRGDGVWIASPY